MRKQSAPPAAPRGASLDDLTLVAVFVRVVELRSFSAAARALGTTTSAVSKRIARLEDRLGARLLSRTTRRLSLTEAGSALFARGSRILAELEAAELEVGRHSDRPHGTLRVNGPVVFGERHVAPLLPEFLATYPEVQLDLSLSDRYVDVVEEGWDAVIRIGRPVDSGLVARRLGTARLVVCAAPSYLERRGVPEEPSDLLAHNCLRYTMAQARSEWTFRAPDGAARALAVSGNLRCDHGGAMHAAVRAGLGIAMLPTFIVDDDLRSGALVELLRDRVASEVVINLVWPAGRHAQPKVKAFADFLAARCKGRLGGGPGAAVAGASAAGALAAR
jgi:DNA-binding transcriptional LysR family regulator